VKAFVEAAQQRRQQAAAKSAKAGEEPSPAPGSSVAKP
jgi:hypothetical protein